MVGPAAPCRSAADGGGSRRTGSGALAAAAAGGAADAGGAAAGCPRSGEPPHATRPIRAGTITHSRRMTGILAQSADRVSLHPPPLHPLTQVPTRLV